MAVIDCLYAFKLIENRLIKFNPFDQFHLSQVATMLLVQRITERYVCRLFILLLFGCSCCQSQGDLSRKHVYKYFMERMPRDFICEGVPKLADIEHELVHCVIDGIRQAVFVVGR